MHGTTLLGIFLVLIKFARCVIEGLIEGTWENFVQIFAIFFETNLTWWLRLDNFGRLEGFKQKGTLFGSSFFRDFVKIDYLCILIRLANRSTLNERAKTRLHCQFVYEGYWAGGTAVSPKFLMVKKVSRIRMINA